MSPAGHGVGGVDPEVQESLHERPCVARHGFLRLMEIGVDLDVPVHGAGKDPDRLPGHPPEIHRTERRGLPPGIGEQLPGQLGGAAGGPFDVGGRLVPPAVFGKERLEE